MPTKFLKKGVSVADDYTGNASQVGVEDTNHTLQFNSSGTKRTVVSTDQTQTLTNKTLTSPTITGPTFSGTLEVGDDAKFTLGDDNDQVLVNRSASLNANTALTGVFIGTPVTQALAANSLAVSNVTASGDIVLAANRGGNSEEYVFIDGSAGKLPLTSPADNLALKAQAAGKKVLINSFTSTDTANSIMGFQSKPGAGASTAQNVMGCEISPRINDTFALTGSGSIIGAHIDTYLKGTTGNIAGSVRCLQLEAVTDDAGTRTVTGDVAMVRMRTAWSGSITGHFVPFLIEKNEVQTGSQNYDAVLKLTSTLAGVWNDAPGTEPSTADGYIKVLVNGNARYIQLYSTAPTD